MLSQTLVSALLLLPGLALAQKAINVNVGQSGLVFQPSSVTADVGDVINFHFYPGDHSVAQATYDNPCEPSGPNAIYSGFFTQTSGVASNMFTVTVNDTSPLWLYCSQSGHCQSGMVMAVNPPSSGQTLNGYTTASLAASSAGSPAHIGGGVFLPNSAAGPSPSSGNGAGNGSPSSTSSPFLDHIATLRTAHGAIMSLTVIFMFPMGALWMRLLGFKGLTWFHAGWQMFSLALLTSGFGIGVTLAKDLQLLYTGPGRTHTTFGTVMFSIIWIQPFLGLAHHFQFIKKQSRTPVSHAHIWYGRALLLLMIINGGLGVKLVDDLGATSNPRAVEIAYGVVAGIMGVFYIAVSSFGEFRRTKQSPAASSSVEEKNEPSNN